ncbi:MAG: enoyl-CoA hydratase/isomerase family protein [Actinobacteria bacterium]|nr:enoyl-CoA hydratase/isomerase family protein [Actinomycetota bacterium]MCB9388430.1 enoyl-CoA hydratase/isomerase family protein [Acidimicrobiia bacterium]
MTDQVLNLRDRSGVRIVTLNRPDALNAFTTQLWDDLRDALMAASADDSVKCVVLTGSGRAFTSGQDLNQMLEPDHDADPMASGYPAFMPALEAFDKPLIAAVNGVAVGIGMTILGFCDLVFIARSARMRVPFSALGVTTEAAASYLLPLRMGWQNAAYAIFTSDWLDAEQAVASGLALRVVDDVDLMDQTLQVADQIATFGVNSLRTSKRLMMAAHRTEIERARTDELEAFTGLIGTEENLAAITAFFARRG